MEVLLGKIVEDIYDFHQPSVMFHKTTFFRETGFKYFLPAGNLSGARNESIAQNHLNIALFNVL